MPRVLSQDPEAVKKREKRNAAKAHQDQTTPITGNGPLGNTDTPPEGLEAEKPPLTPREKKLVKNLAGFYSGIGGFVSMANVLSGAIIIGGAADRAEEMVRMARHHPKLMENLEKLVEGNDTVNMVIGHGAMIFAVLVAVDRIPIGPISAGLLKATGYEELTKIKMQQQGGEVDDRQAVAA